MLVFNREFSFDYRIDDVDDEEMLIDCVQESLRRGRPDQKVVSYDEFRKTAFPTLPATAAPRNPEYLSILFADAEFRTRIGTLGIRHVAFIGGITIKSGSADFIECYRGCRVWTLLTWDHTTRLAATILDLEASMQKDNLSASADDNSWLIVLGALPVGETSDALQHACHDLGYKLAEYLGDRVKR